MNKIKKKNSVISVKSKKGQQLAESKIDFANRELGGYLLKTDFKKKNTSFEVFVHGGNNITLKEYFSTPLNKKTFAVLLKNILVNLKALREKFYDSHNILLDINYVMIDSVYRNVYFAYIPIEPFDSGYSLNGFLLSIAKEAVFEKYEDTSYVNEYIRILNGNKNFSLFDLEEYVQILWSSFNVIKISQIRCPSCNSIIASDSSYCSICGHNLRSETEMSVTGVYDFTKNTRSIRPQVKIETPKTGLVLRKKITGESIEVNKNIFLIGRNESYCDYVLSDLSISGKHACIICKPDGTFYVKDNNSTNCTFINNRRLLPNKEEELTDGCEIRLSDIAFVVSIK